MSNYIVWAKIPKGPQQEGHEFKNWCLVKEVSTPEALLIAKIEAEAEWQVVRVTKEVELEVSLSES